MNIKNDNGYWDKIKLHKQVISKAFSIINTFYLEYSLLFLFDNIISHLIYAKNAIQVSKMNKNIGSK